MINKNVVMVLLLAVLTVGCVHLTDQYGDVVSSVESVVSLSGPVVGDSSVLKALVKGSIYESGEQMSVFGACLGYDDLPILSDEVVIVNTSFGTSCNPITESVVAGDYYIYENFEGLGTPSGWSASNSAVFDSTAKVYAGSESFGTVAVTDAVYPAYSETGIVTTEGWVNVDTPLNHFYIFVPHGDVRTAFLPEGYVGIYNGVSDPTTWKYLYSVGTTPFAYAIDTWYKLVMVNDYDNNTVSGYLYDVNGVLLASRIGVSTTFTAGGNSFGNSGEEGSIDNFRVYNGTVCPVGTGGSVVSDEFFSFEGDTVGVLPSGWTEISEVGDWSIDGTSKINGSNSMMHTPEGTPDDGWEYLRLDSFNYENMTVSATLQGTYLAQSQGVAVRIKDVDNAYFCSMNGAGARIQLYKEVAGVITSLDIISNGQIDAGSKCDVSLSVLGSNVTCTFTNCEDANYPGTHVLSATDTDIQGAGYGGLVNYDYTSGGARIGYYDDVLFSSSDIVEVVSGSSLAVGLASLWKFDELSGVVLSDEVGVNDLFNYNTPTLGLPGVFGTAYHYSRASDEYSWMSNPVGLPNGSSDRTINIRVDGSVVGGSANFIFGYGSYLDNQQVTLYKQADDNIGVGGHGASNDWDTGVAFPLDGLPHMFTLRLESNNMSLFVDGSYAASWIHVYNTGSTYLDFARHPASIPGFGSDFIHDESAIWDVALTDSQIAELVTVSYDSMIVDVVDFNTLTDASFSAYYPNGTQFVFDEYLPEIDEGYYLYTANMSSVQGTYLTELTCHLEGSDMVAKAFGEWQNPFWVARLALLNDSINNINISLNASELNISVDLSEVLDVLDAMNLTIEGIDNTTLTLIQNMQEVNLTTNQILTYVEGMNLTLGDISTAIDGNFTLINFKLDELNLTLAQQNVVLEAINTTIIGQYDNLTDLINNLNISIGDGFDALNQTLISEFSVLNSTMVSNFVNLANLIVNTNATNVAQYNNLTAFLDAMNVSMVDGFNVTSGQIIDMQAFLDAMNATNVANFNTLNGEIDNIDAFLLAMNITMVDGFLSVDNTLINMSAFLDAMNLTMVEGFDGLNSTIVSNYNDVMSAIAAINFTSEFGNLSAFLSAMNASMMSEFSDIDQFLFDMNETMNVRFTSIDNSLLQMNTTLVNTNTVVNALNVSTTQGFIDLTELIDALNVTIDGRFAVVDQNLTSIYDAILNINFTGSNITVNLSSVLSAIADLASSMAANFTALNSSITNQFEVQTQNFTIQLGDFEQNVTDQFEITWDMIESVNASVNITNTNVLSINDTVNYYGGVANSSHTLILDLLYQLLNQTNVTPVPEANGSLNWTEYPDERIIYFSNWDIDVVVTNSLDVRVGWPLVSCYINTTNIPDSVNVAMVSMQDNNQNQDPFFAHSEKIQVLSGFNWTTWCVYN